MRFKTKSILLGVCALGMSACGGIPSEQQEQEPGTEIVKSAILTGDKLAIRFYVSGQCLEDSGGSTPIASECRSSPSNHQSQQWGFPNHNAGIGKFLVENYFSPHCLADQIVGFNHYPRLEGCGSGSYFDSEAWRDPQNPSAGGPPNYSGFKLQNSHSGLCLTTIQVNATTWQVVERTCTTATQDNQSLFLDTFL